MTDERIEQLAAYLRGDNDNAAVAWEALRRLEHQLMPTLARGLVGLAEASHENWDMLIDRFADVEAIPPEHDHLVNYYVRFRINQQKILDRADELALGEKLPNRGLDANERQDLISALDNIVADWEQSPDDANRAWVARLKALRPKLARLNLTS